REFVGVADDHRPLDHVLQLAHVPGPGIGLQAIERPSVHAVDRLARLPRVAIDEILDEERDVVGAYRMSSSKSLTVDKERGCRCARPAAPSGNGYSERSKGAKPAVPLAV